MSTWSPVIFGRTYQVDDWWRALPAGNSAHGWLCEAVLATVAGGNGLVRYGEKGHTPAEPTPRFVLARGAAGTLVGLSCRARALAEDLCQDRHGREIYCFAGWFTADPAARDLPELGELAARPESWAAVAYIRYSRPVWEAASVTVQESVAGEAPWARAQREAGQPVESRLPVLPQQVRLYPAGMAGRLWREAIETPGPFVLVTGWQVARHAALEQVTHLCADDITEPATISRRQEPPQPVKQVPPAKHDQAKADPHPHLDGTRLAQDAQAMRERAKRQHGQNESSWVERLVRLIFSSPGAQPGQPAQPRGQQPTQWQPPAAGRGPGAASAPPSPSPRPSAGPSPQPEPRSQPEARPKSPPTPVELELPKRPEGGKSFEGLE